MQKKEIEKLLSCDTCLFHACEGCETTWTDRKKIREYIDQLENKVKELECDNHNKENKITEQEIFLQMSTEVIKNSLLKQVIREKIEEINKELEKYREYTEQGIETDVEWVDNVADRQIIKVLQELLEEK